MTTKKVGSAKQEQRKRTIEAHQRVVDRKETTGRDHQGNHDSLTRPVRRGDDRHSHGIQQAGPAGQKR